jgi:hypothetical protein
MANKELSERIFKTKKRETEYDKRKSRDSNEIEAEKKIFLDEVIERAEKEFEHYEQGCRSFSIKIPRNQHFSIDDETINIITNAITKKYECDYLSLSLTKIIYPESYTFIFNKLKKDLSKNP